MVTRRAKARLRREVNRDARWHALRHETWTAAQFREWLWGLLEDAAVAVEYDETPLTDAEVRALHNAEGGW